MLTRTASLVVSLGLAAQAPAQGPAPSSVFDTSPWRAARSAPEPTPKPLPVTVSPPAAAPPAPSLSCADGACAPACAPACGPDGQVWVNFAWLFWAASGQPLPPLVTAAPPGTARASAGTLGSPNTTTLFGGRRTNNDFRNGFRVSAGTWLDDDHLFGVEGDFFFLGRSRDGFAAGSDGSQVISRPFFNALTGVQDAELVSFPGSLAGTVTVDSRSSAIGGGVNAVCNLCCSPCGRVDFLLGYRYFNLTDDLTIREDLTSLGGPGNVPAGTRFQITDRFRTANDFHGGVIGLAAERRYSALFVGVRASVALGANTQSTDISGSTTITPPGGPPQVFAGGLLAQPSNTGHYERTVFAVMPEIGVRAGVQVTDHARIYAGYNFLYLSDVARAGDQIDARVNTNQLPPRTMTGGPALPASPGRSTDYYLQGVTAGVEFRF